MSFEASAWLKNFCKDHPIVLGSSSKWRRKVLEIAGCAVADMVAPDIDEKAIRANTPQEMSMLIARAKADEVARKLKSMPALSDAIVICSDQLAVCEGEVREKPESQEEARRFIHSYSEQGYPVSTVTAVVLIDSTTGKRVEGSHEAKTFFNHIPAAVVDEIVKGTTVYTCCGGFSVDDPTMGKHVNRIEGGVDSVMGLPLGLLESLVRELGYN